MLDDLKLEDVLFLDIETVPLVYRYSDLDETMQKLWEQKCRNTEQESAEQQYGKAGTKSEFSKIICISVGFLKDRKFRIKSFFGDDEKALLKDFADTLNRHFSKSAHKLCAHNGKEFDFPFIARRMLINGLRLPAMLNLQGKKPWEIQHLDTMEMWKFGDYKSYTSLSLLAAVFNIPTPKDDISGADVARVYYEEKDLPRIVTYCQKDVITVAQLVLRFRGEPLIAETEVVYTDPALHLNSNQATLPV
jgi:3'-5' exonuclease